MSVFRKKQPWEYQYVADNSGQSVTSSATLRKPNQLPNNQLPFNSGTLSQANSTPFSFTTGQGTAPKTPTQTYTNPLTTQTQTKATVEPVTQVDKQPQKPFSQPLANPFQTKPLDLSGITNITDSQKARYGQQFQDTSNFLTDIYGKINEAIKSQIPVMQNAFDSFKTNTEASITDQEAATERAKQAAEDRFGEAQHQGAMTRRESEGRLTNKFAANNALNSYGAGSYTAASSALESDFNRFTQQNIQSKLNQIDELDRGFMQFKREANSLISQEEAKLKQAIAQINAQVGINDLERDAKIREAYGAYQDKVDTIESYLEGLRMQSAQLQQEVERDYQILQQLSPEFKATGQPTTDLDMYWVQQNPDAYKNLFAGNQQKLTEKQQSYQGAASLTEKALSLLGGGQVKTGIGQGVLGKLGENWGTNSASQQDYRSTIATLRTAVRNALLGANMSPAEMESLMASIPEFNDAPNVAKQKLLSLQQNLPVLAGLSSNTSVNTNMPTLSSFVTEF